ncbi:MAG: tetratricopeptide repeat protein [Candidatus Kapaibacterium sp.]
MINDEIKSHLDKAIRFMLEGKYDEAETCALEICGKLNPVTNDVTEISQIDYQIEALNILGLISFRKSNAIQAFSYYQSAKIIAEANSNQSGLAKTLGNIANVYVSISSYLKGLEYYQQSLTISETIGNVVSVATTLNNIGIVYLYLSDFPQALNHFTQSLELAEVLKNKHGIALTTGNIGTVYGRLNNHNQALEYFNKALILSVQLDNKAGIANIYGSIGAVYNLLNDYQNSLQFYTTALHLHEELDYKSGIAGNMGYIGKLYSEIDNSDYNPKLAEDYMSKSLALYTELGCKKESYEFHQHLAILYKHQKRWEDYTTNIEKYHELYIEVQNEEVKKQADRFGWERKIADMEKEKEIEAVKTNADKRLLEETISFQKQSLEQQAREVKNTVDELVRKNSLLQLIQSDLKKIAPHTKREGTDYIDQLLERVTRNITPLESNQQLDKQLTEVHGEFISNLHQKFPDLTTMELKIAALLSMKLTSSNIAAALFLAKRTVESHRFSLRKKMGLGTNDDIYQALAQYAT